MWMGWGPELTFFYNDAYARMTLGAKHPWALGRAAREVWSEIWADIAPRIEHVLATGEATWDECLLLFLERSGFPEETYHTFSYSPLHDDDGKSRRHLLRCHGRNDPGDWRTPAGPPQGVRHPAGSQPDDDRRVGGGDAIRDGRTGSAVRHRLPLRRDRNRRHAGREQQRQRWRSGRSGVVVLGRRSVADLCPRRRGGAGGAAGVPGRPPAPNHRERILLADDNADMRDYVHQLLAPAWDVQTVTNGRQALNAAIERPPDLVITDVMMPELDGFELLKQLREHPGTADVPVMMLSARAGEESLRPRLRSCAAPTTSMSWRTRGTSSWSMAGT
jgi:CheY-like chemotaxis protein